MASEPDITLAEKGIRISLQATNTALRALGCSCKRNGVVHAEIFFDPHGHTSRGIAFETAPDGIWMEPRKLAS